MAARTTWLFSASFLAFAVSAFAQSGTPCADLAKLTGDKFPNSTTHIVSAKANEASAAKPPNPAAGPLGGPTPALPAHCEVFGAINERTGVNGQKYAIKFHMRLPVNWNGKFFFEGGGGSNGNIGFAYGNLQGQQREVAVNLGYAVVSQDSGHDNAVNNDPERNGPLTHGFDPQARLDHGYNSYDQVTQMARALIKLHYGRAPQRSYFVGCSEGGREAMLMSQRFPDYFDGILACAPGFDLPKSAVFGETWTTHSLAELAKTMGIYDRNGLPFLNKTFSDEDLELVAQAVLGACDGLDNLVDGIIDNLPACTAELVGKKLGEVTCKAGPAFNGPPVAAKHPNCLLPAQVEAIQKVYAGPKDSKGQPLYSDWAWDRGIGGKVGGAAPPDAYNQGWRVWKLGLYDGAQNNSITAALGSLSVVSVFTTPPVVTPTANGMPLKGLLAIDPESEAPKLYAESNVFTTSAWEVFRADKTDLSAFKRHGGKLVIAHGVSDPIFSIKDTIRWYNELTKVNNGDATDFVRMFAVPGMNHCAGGPATDQFNAFDAMVNWVEKGSAPEKIVATAGPATPFPGRTRPLCAYPKQARYTGTGSIEDAANFVCK